MKPLRRALPLALAVSLSACSTLGYYAHLGRGQWQLLSAREPIARVVADPHQDPELRRRLQLGLEARIWASHALALPDNGSYTRYADLGRPYVLWNLFATPELSLEPVQHCFPIAGCVAYRGYYREDLARAEAERLAAQGHDTHVGGVSAYSTLGWFDDPLLNTMLGWSDDQLIETLFHELAHQQLHLPGDTAFNESYASFVGEEGLRQWRAMRGLPPPSRLFAEREKAFVQLLVEARERLRTVYEGKGDAADKRAAKALAFERLRLDYEALRTGWDGWRGYDRFFETPLNNARLLPYALYHQHVAAFAALYAREGRDWPRFHAAARALSQREGDKRRHRLTELAADAPTP